MAEDNTVTVVMEAFGKGLYCQMIDDDHDDINKKEDKFLLKFPSIYLMTA